MVIDITSKQATLHHVNTLLLSNYGGVHSLLLQGAIHGGLDGSTDICDHLESLKALMMLQEMSDVLMCKSFSAIFDNTA